MIGWKKEKVQHLGEYFEFYKHIEKYNADGALKRLRRLKEAADAGNCQICLWILERRFPNDYGRREYRKINVVSEDKNENVEIRVNDADEIRNKIIEKIALVKERL